MFTPFHREGAVTGFAEAKACDLDRFAAFFRGMLDRGIYTAPLNSKPTSSRRPTPTPTSGKRSKLRMRRWPPLRPTLNNSTEPQIWPRSSKA